MKDRKPWIKMEDDCEDMSLPIPPTYPPSTEPIKYCEDCKWLDLTWIKETKFFCLWNGGFHYKLEKACIDFTRKKTKT